MQRDPTPAEIRMRCKAIQATWSEAERLRRIVNIRLHPELRGTWNVPKVPITLANFVLEDDLRLENEYAAYVETVEE